MVVVVVVVVSGFAFGEVQRVDVGPFCMILHNDFAVICMYDRNRCPHVFDT